MWRDNASGTLQSRPIGRAEQFGDRQMEAGQNGRTLQFFRLLQHQAAPLRMELMDVSCAGIDNPHARNSRVKVASDPI
jgi:hypothetical protein